MKFPWTPEFEQLMREKETTLHALERSGLEPQAAGVATSPTVSTARERSSSPAQPFHCGFCHRRFYSYPQLLNHHCDEDR